MVPSAKKKVLFVITKSNWGGAQRYVYDLATSLPKDRFEAVVVLGGTGPLAQKLTDAGIRVIPLSIPQNKSFFYTLFTFGPLFSLVRILRAERPDVLHTNSSKAGGLGALAGRLVGIKKILFTAHGWPFWEPRNALSRALIYLLSWLTALFSHTVIVVSEYDLRVAKKMPFVGHKAVRIYNGINLSEPLQSGELIRSSFPAGVKITGTIGELNKNKNQIALIEQARGNPDMHVAIVGDGENRAYLQKKTEEYNLGVRVKLFGFMPASEVLKGFDTFALPSLKEGLPYVLLEAKAAGLPIVANRVGGVGEILDAKDMSEFSLENMVRKTIAAYE